jgi:transcriptional regulator with XRE-family HTH domain
MKKNDIRTLLGITQQEIATLLGIHRSQWSMFESGQRDLPLAAQQLLAEILTHVNSTEKPAKSESHSDKQNAKNQQQLERLLRENEYQQLRLARKIAAVEKKHTAQLQLSLLVEFLNHRQATTGKIAGAGHESISRKVVQADTTNHAAILIEHHLKQELLHFERSLLESKIPQRAK